MAKQTPRCHRQGWLKQAVTVVSVVYAALAPTVATPTLNTTTTASCHILNTL
jgi:hypothetical protein